MTRPFPSALSPATLSISHDQSVYQIGNAYFPQEAYQNLSPFLMQILSFRVNGVISLTSDLARCQFVTHFDYV